ncbi:MAG: response regulator transcription factor [Microthrixaceae bacterium]
MVQGAPTGTADVLVVEDDPSIADLLDLYLRREGHRVHLAASGERGLELWQQHRPQVVLLDVGLPGIDGLEVCRRIRASDPHVAVLFLTARDEELDRVLGLELGADDYVTKPFSPREVVARVKVHLRRAGLADAATSGAGAGTIRTVFGDVVVDEGRREVTDGGAVVPLTTQEFDLLAHLCRNRGLALSRRQILDGAWGADWVGDERTVDVHVAQVRRKLPDLPLATVRGVGYRLD